MLHTTLVNMTGADLLLLYFACQLLSAVIGVLFAAFITTLKALFF